MSNDDDDVPEGLSPFQVEVAREFFELPESADFLLAGGAALLALRLIRRFSRDLDLFTSRDRVDSARVALDRAAIRRGWTVEPIVESQNFARLIVRDGNAREVLIDLGVDSPPRRRTVATNLGPTFAPEELAGQKLLALFGRAEARDFTDVHALALRFGKESLLQRAAELDAGFSTEVLAEMIGTINRFKDTDLPTEHPTEIREFFRAWRAELRR